MPIGYAQVECYQTALVCVIDRLRHRAVKKGGDHAPMHESQTVSMAQFRHDTIYRWDVRDALLAPDRTVFVKEEAP